MYPRWRSSGSLILSISLLCLPGLKTVYGGNAPLVLDLLVERQPANDNHALRRRTPQFVSTDLGAFDNIFFANLQIGTPSQEMRLGVSTNVADTAVLSPDSSYCKSNSCSDLGTYDGNLSSTYQHLGSNYSTQYADGTGATGDWVIDTVSFAGVGLGDLHFGIEYDGQVNYGILGLGYVQIETYGTPYPNFPFLLYNKALINIIGYSLWVDPTNTSVGTLAFGGIDTNKFIDTLETLPISVDDVSYSYVTIDVAGMKVTTDSKGVLNLTKSSFPAVIDSGASVLSIPSSIANQIYSAIDAVYDASVGAGVLKISDIKHDTTLGITFGSTTINIPIKDLVIPANDTYYYVLVQPSDSGGSASDQITGIIGLPLFMSAYLVFDFSHNQVSLAPINKQRTASNITAIDKNGVMGVSGVPDPSSTTTSNSSPKGTSSGGSKATNTNSSSGLSTGAKAGIGVGVALGVVVLLSLILGFIIFRRHKRRAEEQKKNEKADDIGPQSNWAKAELPATEGHRYKELDGSHQPRPTPGGLDATNRTGHDRSETLPGELPGSTPGPYELPALPTSPTTDVGSSVEDDSNKTSKMGSERTFGSSAGDQKTLIPSSEQRSSSATASNRGIVRKPVPKLGGGSSSAS